MILFLFLWVFHYAFDLLKLDEQEIASGHFIEVFVKVNEVAID